MYFLRAGQGILESRIIVSVFRYFLRAGIVIKQGVFVFPLRLAPVEFCPFSLTDPSAPIRSSVSYLDGRPVKEYPESSRHRRHARPKPP